MNVQPVVLMVVGSARMAVPEPGPRNEFATTETFSMVRVDVPPLKMMLPSERIKRMEKV